MPLEALTSAEISLPPRPDALRVRERIAALADSVDLVALTDNHAGEARMSPLAAVALAREQGVRTVVHISCRDRNRLALQSQVVGAAALGAEGILCVQGDPVDDVPRVGDLTATRLIRRVKDWAAPQPIAVGAVVNPFADDVDREIALLERKLAAGAEFVQSQMTFDVTALTTFLDRAAGLLHDVRFYAGLALLRNERMYGRPSTRTTRLRAARRGPPPDRARRRHPARKRTGARARGHRSGGCAAHLPARRRIGDTRRRSRVPNRARRAGLPPLNTERSLRRGSAVRPPTSPSTVCRRRSRGRVSGRSSPCWRRRGVRPRRAPGCSAVRAARR